MKLLGSPYGYHLSVNNMVSSATSRDKLEDMVDRVDEWSPYLYNPQTEMIAEQQILLEMSK